MATLCHLMLVAHSLEPLRTNSQIALHSALSGRVVSSVWSREAALQTQISGKVLLGGCVGEGGRGEVVTGSNLQERSFKLGLGKSTRQPS